MPRANRPSRQHLAVTREAGLGRISWISILAGLVTAYGAFAIVASIVGAVLSSLDVDTDFRSNDWTSGEAGALLATAVVLLLSYLFGGYVAGRMGRRAAVLHGLGVFLGSLVIAAVVSGVVGGLADDDQLRSNLRSVGIPTTWDQVSDVALVGVIVSLAAMLVGAVAGSVLGERWHTKLARRAADPEIGPAADLRRRADAEDAARRDRIEQDEVLRRESAPRTDDVARDRDRDRDGDRDRDRDDVVVVPERDEVVVVPPRDEVVDTSGPQAGRTDDPSIRR